MERDDHFGRDCCLGNLFALEIFLCKIFKIVELTIKCSQRTHAPPGAYVNLLADPPSRPLCKKLGFKETGEACIGMEIQFLGA